jgi:N-acetylmuramoyl-L-alanine amidase
MARFSSYFFFLFLIFFSILNICYARPAIAAPQVSDIRITQDTMANTVRFELDINQHVPYRAFLLDNPRRVVIDFPAMQWKAPLNKGDNSGLIRSYRQGLFHQDTLRLVLDVSQPVRIVKTETRASGQSGIFKYIIYMQNTTQQRFSQGLNKVVQPHNHVGQVAQKPTGTVTTRVTQTVTTTVEPVATSGAPTKKLIILDPGHGGVDPGAISAGGIYEKNITLSVARELKRQLEETGRYRVKMTRDSDIFIKLQDRVKIARQAKGDLFVSLHADSIGRPAVQGASVYTLSNQASDAESARLAERENQVDALVGGVDLGVQDKDVADILLDLVVRDNMNQSKILADTVVGSLRKGGVQTLQGSHRFAGFAVLKAPDIPSILIEMGYLSNREEAQLLNTQAHRERIARAVRSSIDTYFNETSKKTEF